MASMATPLFLTLAALAYAGSESLPISPGNRIEPVLRVGAPDRFSFSATAGEYLEIVVEPQGSLLSVRGASLGSGLQLSPGANTTNQVSFMADTALTPMNTLIGTRYR
jgi:hypothetical protein